LVANSSAQGTSSMNYGLNTVMSRLSITLPTE
jgi:hypothetical protein